MDLDNSSENNVVKITQQRQISFVEEVNKRFSRRKILPGQRLNRGVKLCLFWEFLLGPFVLGGHYFTLSTYSSVGVTYCILFCELTLPSGKLCFQAATLVLLTCFRCKDISFNHYMFLKKTVI